MYLFLIFQIFHPTPFITINKISQRNQVVIEGVLDTN